MAKNNKELNNTEVAGFLLMMLGSFFFNFSLATGFRIPIFLISGVILFIIGMITAKFEAWDTALVVVAIISLAMFRDLAIIIPGAIGLVSILIRTRE